MNTQAAYWDAIPKTRLHTVDCTAPFEDGRYFEIGNTEIVSSPIGAYRLAARQVGSRFGYRFPLTALGQPHLLTVTYPDNARRLICIQDGTSYDLTAGIATGGDLPPSGEMQTLQLLFFPRFADCSIVFTTYGYPAEEPAAIASFSVDLLHALPEAEGPRDLPFPHPHRMMGFQYEDPCNVGSSEGAMDFTTWLDRHVKTMKASGQELLAYPLHWYHGPQIPLSSQPHARLNSITCPDRKIYSRSTFDTPDWVEELLSRFDAEGMSYIGTLTLMRMGNLMKLQNTSPDAIQAGADTVNNILYNGQPQTSVNDWTGVYNPLILPQWIDFCEKGGAPFSFGALAYGERRTTSIRTPIFNPLHPEVRRQLIEYFTEIATRYAHHPSFKGLSVNFWHGTMLWYGNLLCGYDDIAFAAFAQDSGIEIPIDPRDPDRFGKRYEFILAHCKEAFVDWRCHKIRELILALRDALRSAREDLTLGITVWNETSLPGYLPGEGHMAPYTNEGMMLYHRPSNYEIYREGGLDLALYGQDEGITVTVEHNFARDRSMACDGPIQSRRFTDHAFLDHETHRAVKATERAGGFHFDCWVELWGNHTKFLPPEDDPNLPLIRSLPDYEAQFIFRENSSYPDDPEGKFFFDSQLRICSPHPSGVGYLEQLTMDIALHDSLFLTSGGLYLDKAHLPERLELAKEYRRLPALPFLDLPSSGPVTARYLTLEGTTYLYCVNREPYPLPVRITCADQTLEATIAPFMLKVWTLPEAAPLRAVAAVPASIRTAYTEACKALLSRIDPQSPLARDLTDAMQEERYADLRHLLNSYEAKAAQGDPS